MIKLARFNFFFSFQLILGKYFLQLRPFCSIHKLLYPGTKMGARCCYATFTSSDHSFTLNPINVDRMIESNEETLVQLLKDLTDKKKRRPRDLRTR